MACVAKDCLMEFTTVTDMSVNFRMGEFDVEGQIGFELCAGHTAQLNFLFTDYHEFGIGLHRPADKTRRRFWLRVKGKQ